MQACLEVNLKYLRDNTKILYALEEEVSGYSSNGFFFVR